MLVMNVTAFGIYRMTGSANPFHVGTVCFRLLQ